MTGTDKEGDDERAIRQMKADRDDQIRRCSAAVGSEPDNWKAWYELGVAHAEAFPHDLALEAYGHVADLRPGWWEVWLSVGHVYARKRQMEDAATDADKAAACSASSRIVA